MTPARYLHKALLKVRENVEAGRYPPCGICTATLRTVSAIASNDSKDGRDAGQVLQRADDILNTIMVTWPEYSGCMAYPVNGDYRPDDSDYMWARGEYAAARRRLLNYCINVAERMV